MRAAETGTGRRWRTVAYRFGLSRLVSGRAGIAASSWVFLEELRGEPRIRHVSTTFDSQAAAFVTWRAFDQFFGDALPLRMVVRQVGERRR